MRILRSLGLIGILTLNATVGADGQTTVVQPTVPAAIVVDIALQSDSPIRLLDVGDRPAGIVVVTFKVQNNASLPIRGYVLVVDTGKGKRTYTTILPEKPIEPGKSASRGIGTGRESRLSIAVDHVLFTDGTTWGTDTYGRSKLINSYIEGRELAVTRLRELVGDADAADFLAPLKVFGSYSIGGPVSPERAGFEILQRQKGYYDVLSSLRRMTKRKAEAQELARKLELMETPAN